MEKSIAEQKEQTSDKFSVMDLHFKEQMNQFHSEVKKTMLHQRQHTMKIKTEQMVKISALEQC